MHFASDNIWGAAPRIVEALATANDGAATAYGGDEATARVEAKLAELFEREVAVLLVATGTAANALAIAAYSPPWGAVLCHADSHVMTDECGAPEAFSGGAKLVGLSGRDGKVTPGGVETALAGFKPGFQHHVVPSVLSLTQASEMGTVYTVDEIAALADLAHGHGMSVHMDGARFANALVSLDVAPADMTWRAGVDVLSFGATKNGAFAAEALVLFDPARAQELVYRRKRMGHLVSKHRFLAVQMEAYLADGYWLDLARHANRAAARLAAGLEAAGCRLAAPVQANEVFPIFARDAAARLREAGASFYDWRARVGDVQPGEGEIMARLVTSWATSEESVDAFLAVLHRVEVAS